MIGGIQGLTSKKISLNYQYPIKYFEENLYFKRDKSCWAIFKLESFAYDFKSKNEKFNFHASITRMLWNIGLEGQIRIIPVISSLSEDNENLKRSATGPLKMVAIKEIDEETEDLTKFLGNEGNEYEFYIVVKLQNNKGIYKSLVEFGKSLYQDPIRLINEYAGLESPEIFLREVEAYRNFEDIIFHRIKKYVKISRTDEFITETLIRHPFYFGIGNPPMRGSKSIVNRIRTDKSKTWQPKGDIIIRDNGDKYLRPHEKDILTLTEGEINIRPLRHIEITQFYNGKDITTLQAHIIISEMPDIQFPGGEWIYDLLSDIKFPMSISIRFKVLEYKASMAEVKKKQKDLADQNEHIQASNSAIPIDLMESSEEAYNMEYDLKNQKFPLLYTTIIIAVSAKNKEMLQKRIEDVKGHLGDIRAEIPAGDQWNLFNEMALGGDQFASDYVLKLSPEHLAGAMIGATKKLGDPNGFYMAITGQLKKQVRMDTGRASKENKAPNMTFSGSQGGGKSFTADLITCKSVKVGAKAVIIDPKGDRTYWEQDLKSFKDQVKVTTFTAATKDKGKLDPFNIMRTGMDSGNYEEKMREAAALALDICMFLIASDRKDQRTRYLLEAVSRVVIKPRPSMNRIIDEFRIIEKESEEQDDLIKKNSCKDIRATLSSYRKMAYASLLFGDGDEEAVDLEKQINVLQIQNLVFPKEGTLPDAYTFSEIIGYACLLAISGYIMTFIMGDRSILKIFELDEVTVFNATPVGKNLINKLQRMARALNTPGMFITQSVDDVGDGSVKNNIGYKFAFKSTDEDEVKKILKYFGLEETEANMRVINELENGVCLFQDLDGRTGVIAIDAVFEEYTWAFDTKPDTMTKKKQMYVGG